MKQLHTTCLVLILLISSFGLHAQWSADPLVDNNLFATVYDPMTFCSDGRGGAFFAWHQTFDGQNQYVRMNRIDSAGHLLYGDSGIVLRHFGPQGGQPGNPAICIDGQNGCYIAYTHSGLQKQPTLIHHIAANGTQVWADTGLRVVDNYPGQFYTTQPKLINAGTGGVMIAYVVNNGPDGGGLDVQKLNFNGDRQWGPNGHRVQGGTDLRDPHMISDGNGGFGITWTDVSSEHGGFDAKALRFACFDGSGVSRMAVNSINIEPQVQIGAFAQPILTHNKDFIILTQKLSINYKVIYAHKVHPNGTLGWGGNGVIVRDTVGEVRTVHGITDGGEGVYLTWVDGRKVGIGYGQYMQHIRADSSKAWAPQGLPVDTASMAGYGFLSPDLNGRFKIVWQDDVSRRIRMQVADSTGHLLIPGDGSLITDGIPGRDLFYENSSVPSVNNHLIIFLKGGGGKTTAKFAPLGAEIPLIVHFIDFTVLQSGGINQLNWHTENEENIGDYIIEHSADGNNFSPIGNADAFNTPGVHAYTFDDTGSHGALVYYRIKEVDLDGNVHYSSIVSIGSSPLPAFFVGPNPAIDHFTINADHPFTANGTLTIADFGGRLMKTMALPVSQSSVVIDTRNWPGGLYLVMLIIDGKKVIKKVMIMH